MTGILDPSDPDDFRVMWAASDEWGRARLLERVAAAPPDGIVLTAASS